MKVVESHQGVIDQFSYRMGGNWEHCYLSNGFIEPDGSFVEREYQAAKALHESDAAKILACDHPFGKGGAKRLGREIEMRPDWDDVRYRVMARLVMRKFLDHPDLADKLLATGDSLLVEGNTWHDNIWGDCRCGRPECQATGLNWLGLILMAVREALRQMQPKQS